MITKEEMVNIINNEIIENNGTSKFFVNGEFWTVTFDSSNGIYSAVMRGMEGGRIKCKNLDFLINTIIYISNNMDKIYNQ